MVFHGIERFGDQLQMPLVGLDPPADHDEAGVGEAVIMVARRVPHPHVHGAGGVAAFGLDKKLGGIGLPHLLAGEDEYLLDEITVSQLGDCDACHMGSCRDNRERSRVRYSARTCNAAVDGTRRRGDAASRISIMEIAMPVNIPVGLQLYSVRNDCARDLPAVLKEVARMGYEGVEFAGYHGRSAEEIRSMLDDLGLKCCGTHTKMPLLEGDEFEKTVEFNQV